MNNNHFFCEELDKKLEKEAKREYFKKFEEMKLAIHGIINEFIYDNYEFIPWNEPVTHEELFNLVVNLVSKEDDIPRKFIDYRKGILRDRMITLFLGA